MMNAPGWILTLVLAAQAGQGKHDSAAESRDVRIYFIERSNPPRSLKDVSVSLTVTSDSGTESTALIPLVEGKSPSPEEQIGGGMLRGVSGTPYFVELAVEPSKVVAPKEPGASAESSAGPRADGLLSPAEALKRAHRGAYFGRSLPASLFSAPYRATITIRLGNEASTSEEFQNPSPTPRVAAEGALSSTRLLWKLAEAGGTFSALKPVASAFLKQLDQLAPAGFADDSGALEQDRQWCLGLGRAIEDACDRGNTGLVQNLAAQCEPRLKNIQSRLAPRKDRSSNASP
jgi:hypothetical protein